MPWRNGHSPFATGSSSFQQDLGDLQKRLDDRVGKKDRKDTFFPLLLEGGGCGYSAGGTGPQPLILLL